MTCLNVNCIIINYFFISDPQVWKRKWNRFIDTYDDDENKRKYLLEIELSIFRNIQRREVKDLGLWQGTKLQNRRADEIISEDVSASFKAYEGGKHYQGNFFLFKRI